MFRELIYSFRLRVILVFLAITSGIVLFFWDSFSIEVEDFSGLNNSEYYTEQINKIYNDYNKGVSTELIENYYNCEIVLYTDDNYGAKLNNSSFNDSLLIDFCPNGIFSVGKIRFNLKRDEINSELTKTCKDKFFKRLAVVVLLYFIGGIVCLIIYLVYKKTGR